MIWAIVLVAVGVYCIFSGIKTILTGSISAREEARLNGFSKKGVRTYKLIYSVINILGGLLIIGLGVVKYLEIQNILADTLAIRIGGLVVALIMAAVLLIARSKCKNMTDDE